MPEDADEVRKMEKAIDDASAGVADWDATVKQAAVDAIKEGKNPVNAALAKTMEA